jgi:DHA2 family multidrug resistance protein-like MFS transporter
MSATTLPETTEPAPRTGRATRREWIGLAVIALPCLLYTMDLTVLNLAVPALSADLRPSGAQLLWIVDVYGFMVAGSLITMGALGDRIGRRRLLLYGALSFGVASVLAAFASSPAMLIAARAVLGLAGATLAPSTLSLIRTMFRDPGQRTTAIGVWITCFSAGAAIGPLLGGVLLEHFWWGSVFLLGVPVMLLLLVLGPILLPEHRVPTPTRLDLPSVGMSLAAVLLLIYGLKRTAIEGPDPVGTATVVVGLLVGVVFLRRQTRLTDPLVDLRLLRTRAFGGVLALNLIGFFAVFGVDLFVAQYLQLVLGLSPLKAGLWTMPTGLGFIAGSMLTPIIVRRYRPWQAIVAGLVIAVLGFGALTQVGGASALAVLVAGTFLLALGTSPLFTLATDLALGSVPADKAGTASGISETSSEFGGALGIAILGTVGTAVYRASIDPRWPESARSSLGGALGVVNKLPNAQAEALARAAKQAFGHALHVCGTVAAASAAVVAVLAVLLLRRIDTNEVQGHTGTANHDEEHQAA